MNNQETSPSAQPAVDEDERRPLALNRSAIFVPSFETATWMRASPTRFSSITIRLAVTLPEGR